MLFTLSMRQVTALIGMKSKAEPTLIGADMVAHEIGVFGNIDGFKSQFPDSFPPFNIGVLVAGDSDTSGSGTGSMLPVDHFVYKRLIDMNLLLTFNNLIECYYLFR